jgi:phospholipid/cholesterol/gamma-HCH transport system ATP-binding protein
MNETLTKPARHEALNPTGEAVIEIIDLSVSFGSHDVLKNVSLNVYNGENLVIVGKSGTGKSVMVKCIVGLINSYRGKIIVMKKDVKSLDRKGLNEMRKQIGFLFQSGALYDSMSVRQNLEFPLRRIRKDLSEKQISQKIADVLENVGLSGAVNKMPSELSGGMRKRIGLARSIIVDPLIMLYDEPTTGLDPTTSDEISSLINSVREKYRTSSVIITHDMKCACKTADRIIVLKDGKVYREGNCTDFENSPDPFISSFFS